MDSGTYAVSLLPLTAKSSAACETNTEPGAIATGLQFGHAQLWTIEKP